jgi:hypothetical protein
MKTRNGFVSNSSSSSFVLIMKEISVEDLKNKRFATDGIIFAQGDDLGEGVDFFPLDLDSKMTNFLSKHYYDGQPDNTQLQLYIVYWKSEEDYSEINKEVWDKIGKILPNESAFLIESKEISQHSSEDLATMRERYFSNVIDEEEEKQKELDAYNKLKEDLAKEKEKTKKLEEELKQKQRKLKIKED